MQEAVFKTRFYEHEVDSDGTKMTEYEDLGDKLKWKHNGDSDGSNLRTDNDGSNSKST